MTTYSLREVVRDLDTIIDSLTKVVDGDVVTKAVIAALRSTRNCAEHAAGPTLSLVSDETCAGCGRSPSSLEYRCEHCPELSQDERREWRKAHGFTVRRRIFDWAAQ